MGADITYNYCEVTMEAIQGHPSLYETVLSAQVFPFSIAPPPFNLFPLTLENFSALGHEDRLQVFSRMLDLCSLQDLLTLRRELEVRLTRDFLTLLPPEISVMILSYLPVEGLVTGLQVCSGWREVISGATLLWRNAARKIELSETILKTHLPTYGSYMCLTLMALKHRKCLSSYVPEVMVEYLGVYPDRDVYFDRTCSGSYAFFETRFDSADYRLDIKKVLNDRSVVTLHSIDDPAKALQCGPFAPSGNKGFVFWGNVDSGWIGWSDSGRLDVWNTNEIEGSFLAVCPSCGLIALLSPEHGVVRVKLRRLAAPGVSKLGDYIVVSELNFAADPEVELDVFPKQLEPGVCGCHYLTVQPTGQDLTLYLLPAESSSTNNRPLEAIKIPKEVLTDNVYEHGFCFSLDGLIATNTAFFHAGHRHIWEPDTERVVTLSSPFSCGLCIAIGQLYAILTDARHLEVVETYTGIVLLCVPMKWPDHEYSFSYVEQSWLSTFMLTDLFILGLRLEIEADGLGVGTVDARCPL